MLEFPLSPLLSIYQNKFGVLSFQWECINRNGLIYKKLQLSFEGICLVDYNVS